MACNVALIGYGAIARKVIELLDGDAQVAVSQVLVRKERRDAVQSEAGPDITAISDPAEIAPGTDFVLECAGHEAVVRFAPAILRSGIDFGVISVGALAQQKVLDQLTEAARDGDARLTILPGAIGGIDALAAAGDALDKVVYSARKAPQSWKGSPAEDTHDLSQINAATVLYSGSARQAATDFPKNANVVATVALAGVGFERTTVSLIADPDATGNTHRIEASGGGYDLRFETSGAALPENPRTSALTALSVVRAIRARAPGLVI